MSEVLHSFAFSGNAVNSEKISKTNFQYDILTAISSFKMSLTDSRTGFTAEERLELLDFLCVKPLSDEEFREDVLKSHNWIKENDQSDSTSFYNAALLSAMLKQSIFYVKGITFDMLQSFGCDLFTPQNVVSGVAKCSFTPARAILQQTIPSLKAELNDDMQVEISYKNEQKEEPLIQCLFRHLRNSIAHDYTYVNGDDILFIDFAPKLARITAIVFVKKKVLTQWISLLKCGKTKTGYILELRNNKYVFLRSMSNHPFLITHPVNILVKSNGITVKKKMTDEKTTSWEETTDIIFTKDSAIDISGVTADSPQNSEICIGSVDFSQASSGKYKIVVPLKMISLDAQKKINDQLFLFIDV